MAKKTQLNTPDYEKKYKRLRIVLFIFLLLFALFVYINYDYLAFKFFISYNYAYTDSLDELYKNEIGEENVKGYFRNFDDVAIASFTEKIRAVSGDKYTYLYTPAQYAFTKEYEKESVKEAVARELTPNTAYIFIPGVSKYTRKFIYDNEEFLAGYENLVFDLRTNPGGKLNDMYKIADLFLEEGQTIAFEDTRHAVTSSTLKAKGTKELEYDEIIFLQDSQTASACEGLIMALKENLDNVTIIGETSFGKGIGQYTMPLKGGFAVKATVMRSLTPHGNSIHQKGITPDIEYTGDDILGFVTGYIEET
ncbi:MAG: S41 family peptidase [Clostridiales bacterium]|jgi:C-terminal processing protease CtpA/Prc|nr:S41 family peptidase [Clostridiales bacterium]